MKTVKDVVDQVSTKHHKKISFELTSDDQLNLDISKADSNNFVLGNILIDCYKLAELKKCDIINYSIRVNSSQADALSLSVKEMGMVTKHLETFNRNKQMLIAGKREEFYSLMNPEIHQIMPFDEFTQFFDKLVKSGYPVFEGFIMSEYKSERYIIFRSSVDKHYIMISFKFDEASNIMYALELV